MLFHISYEKTKDLYLDFQYKKTIKIEQQINEQEESKPKEVKEKQNKQSKGETLNCNNTDQKIWKIEIPKINLEATIAEGTSEEIMNKYIGHFEDTEKWNGNVGLAAHNRRISC